MKKTINIIGFLVLTAGLFSVVSAQSRDTVVVRFHDTGELLNNPGKGFMTFQRFNGDKLNPPPGWTEGFPIEYQEFDGNLENENHPHTTIAYHRVYWRYVEPEERQYNWELIDKALKTARERGQRLMLRIPAYGSGTDVRRDVPDWYRGMVGDRREWAHSNPVNAWLVDPEDPRYVKFYGGMIRALGERYDGHPDLESVDMALVGAWGEGGGSALLTQQTREGLVNSYTDVFRLTPLKMLLTDVKTNAYGLSQANVGYRFDCLGDLGFWAADQDGWTHMYDYYAQRIIETGMRDAWKKGPVSLEICGTFTTWKNRHGYGLDEVQYIFDQALKWRISSFNAKSSPVLEEWKEAVDDWIKKMGYRFVLRRFSYPREVAPNGKLDFTSWWENKGVAPIYQEYPLALRLRNGRDSAILLTEVDIRGWLPGDNLYNDAVFVPHDLPPGEYELELALTEPVRVLGTEPKPAVHLPIDARTADGWYRLGRILVKQADQDTLHMRSDELSLVVVNNQPYGEVHRGSLSGISELYPQGSDRNFFRVAGTGLNFEFIFNGDSASYGWNRFEPRRSPMDLVRLSPGKVQLRQSRTENWPLQSIITYELSGNLVEMTYEGTLSENVWDRHGYLGVFFASYINEPEEKGINFIGKYRSEENTEARWVYHLPPEHGREANHRPAGSDWDPTFDEGFPLTLVSGFSDYEYIYPFYYGRSGEDVMIMMFDQSGDDGELRFAQSPNALSRPYTNPAWDFVWFQKNPVVGETFRFRAAMIIKKFEGVDDVIDQYEEWSGNTVSRTR